MEKYFVKFNSIDNVKNARKQLQRYRPDVQKVTLYGLTKIHGTNAAVVMWKDGTTTYQSRSRIIEPGDDNHGFAAYASEINWWDLMGVTPETFEEFECDAVVFFGEWCGGNIQKGVGITGMEKAFVVFSVMTASEVEGEVVKTRVGSEFPENEHRVFPIAEFGLHTIQGFHVENMTQDDKHLCQIRDEIEKECPVAARLNPENDCQTGEGLVWYVVNESSGELVSVFKHKGDDHKRVPKKPVQVFTEGQEACIVKFLQVALTDDRLMQGKEVLRERGLDDGDMKNFGEYLKWLNRDIMRELRFDIEYLDSDHDLDWRKLSKSIPQIAREFYENN